MKDHYLNSGCSAVIAVASSTPGWGRGCNGKLERFSTTIVLNVCVHVHVYMYKYVCVCVSVMYKCVYMCVHEAERVLSSLSPPTAYLQFNLWLSHQVALHTGGWPHFTVTIFITRIPPFLPPPTHTLPQSPVVPARCRKALPDSPGTERCSDYRSEGCYGWWWWWWWWWLWWW